MTSTAANDRTPSVPPELYVDPNGAATQAATTLDGQTKRDALMLAKMPAATWFTKGSPGDVEASVRDLVDRAATAGRMPVLVAYNIPLRDCQLYSAGGAANTDTYISWIKGFAAGIGDRAAIVVLEPDSLGVIPWHRTLSGTVENCQPKDVDRAAISAARFTQLSKAVDILSALPNARIYLDATNSNWLPPGEAISRLLRANIARADGFFLNVSNFESDDRVSRYARWVSDCLALVTIKRFLAKD
ncbi:MAG: glycoside hydrolase family 6 protein, partial [Sphingomonas sp.]